MLDNIIRFSLNHRMTLIFFAVVMSLYGMWTAAKLPVDVFPNLNRPRVTVITEAHGLAPEEVETLVTLPIEQVLNGAPGVVRIWSSSGIGVSIVHVDFDWGTQVFTNRQLVAERLRLAQERLPEDLTPTMAPISSIMGEIQFVGLTSEDDSVSPMELRTLADWTVRPRLMTISGISQVVVMGGQVKQYRILVSFEKMERRRIPLEDMKHALSEISENTTGGFINLNDKEFLIRPLGRVESIEHIEESVIHMHFGIPVKVKDIAEVKIEGKVKRGEASINGRHSVVMTIQKQPSANTIELTNKIDEALTEMQKTLPKGVKVHSDLFKQSRFIEASIDNVKEALVDGAIMVALIIFLFLLNIRTTAITLIAIPLSLVVTAIVFKLFDISINTMTLGGLAIAVGELVDDAIVDVENVFRRLKENKMAGSPVHPLTVVYKASSEVRNSIVLSTIIVVLVFIPLFALGGIEGRLFAPLGVAYIISLIASLFVSLTVTPVLCYWWLPNGKFMEHKEGWVIRKVKNWNERILHRTIHRPYLILGVLGVVLVGCLLLLPLMGKNFLPKFNEGTATIGVAAAPGISLPASDALGTKIEEAMLSIPEVKSTIRRTGRAEMDEHAEGVHWSEIDVDFHPSGGRDREVVLKELRDKINAQGDIYVNVGQPISHRLDHLLSGVRSQIAVKIFGPELPQLRWLGSQVKQAMAGVQGIVDLQIEQLVLVPQLKIAIDREEAARYGLRVGTIAEDLELALNGAAVSKMIEKNRFSEIFVRFDDDSRRDADKIESIIVKTMPTGQHIRLGDIASVYEGTGPNMVNREDVQRRIVVQANSDGRDLGSLIQEVKANIAKTVTLPDGYFIEYGGQFKSQQEASSLIALLGTISMVCVFLVLYSQFRSGMLSIQIMLNVPLALIGSILAIYFTERVLSVATLIAFITLCGIATRNGIMMISHYIHLMKEEGEEFGEAMVIRGSLERLIPVLMTAFSAVLALFPLLISKGQPGKEILHPVAVVIVGGLMTSTLLDIIVTPSVFLKFGKKAALRLVSNKGMVKLNNKGEVEQ